MLNPIAGIMVSELLERGMLPPAPRAVDLGDQTFSVSAQALEGIIDRLHRSPEARAYKIDYGELTSLLEHQRRMGPRISAAVYYRALGFAQHDAIDINSPYESLVMDLNFPLAERYGFTRVYDLVVNTGTSEHVFDQATVMRNAHALTAPGGVILHVLPFTGYVDHGFFNYQPGFFRDLAAANGYKLERLLVADRNGPLLNLQEGSARRRIPPHYYALLTPNKKNNTNLVVVMRKQAEAPFTTPCQGKYLATVEDEDVKIRYAAQQGARDGAGSPEDRPGRLARLRGKLRWKLLMALRAASRFVLLRL